MKKYLVLASLMVSSLFASAQSEFDALKYSKTDITGTARFVGMSGAFGALGGDMSAINVNPAGIGVYRSSELSLSPNIQMDDTKTTLDGTNANANKFNILMNGFGYVGSFRTYDESAISNFNFGITYNRTADFNRNTRVLGTGRKTSFVKEICFMENWLLNDGSPYTTPYWNFMNMSPDGIKVLDQTGSGYVSKVADGELANSDMDLKESGGIDNWNFTLGANYNHSLYVGLGIGLQYINYEMTSSYIEDFSATKGMELRNALSTNGAGVNFKIGAIYRPVPELRLGLSYNTGTYYMLTDVFAGSMASWGFTNPGTGSVYADNQRHIGAEQSVDYIMRTPQQATMSAAYQFGKQGLLSVDVDLIDNPGINLKDANGVEYTYINDAMTKHFKEALNIRVGGEWRMTDNFSARLGGAVSTSPVVSTIGEDYIDTPYTRPNYSMPLNTYYASMGLGYRSGAFFADVALQEKMSNERFYNYYDDISIAAGDPTFANLNSNRTNLVLTAGIKF